VCEALVIQQAMRMRRIIFVSVMYMAVLLFISHLINGAIFEEKQVIEHEV
jgi:hypothetical protein